MKKTLTIITVAMFISMEIIFTRFLSFQTDIARISFGFLPIALCAAIFGPVMSGIAAALSDILGMLIFPKGAYFPGFTFSTLLSGVIYGLFFYKKPLSIKRIILASLSVTIFVNLGLNTLWLSIITKNPLNVLLVTRFLSNIVTFIFKVITLSVTWKYLGKFIQNYRNKHEVYSH